MRIFIIDNYDSFTYNLSHLVKSMGADVSVLRNDRFCLDDLDAADRIILSPGPGIPQEAGLTLSVIDRYKGVKPILGVCLGHQAIGEYFGAHLVNLSEVYHGVQTSATLVRPDPLFRGLPSSFQVGRYHSWAVEDGDSLPSCLEVIAKSPDDCIMALRHTAYDICGVQFHPESVLTPQGSVILSNWMEGR